MFSNSLSLRVIRALVNSMSVETLRVAEAQAREANEKKAEEPMSHEEFDRILQQIRAVIRGEEPRRIRE
jgi:D-ribose pyranose/furanose isomerase RbsD